MILVDNLSFAIGVFAGVNTVNDDEGVFDIETNAIFSDPESMGGWRKVYQGFGKVQWIMRGDVKPDFFYDSVSQLTGEVFKVPFSGRSKLKTLDHLAGLR